MLLVGGVGVVSMYIQSLAMGWGTRILRRPQGERDRGLPEHNYLQNWNGRMSVLTDMRECAVVSLMPAEAVRGIPALRWVAGRPFFGIQIS